MLPKRVVSYSLFGTDDDYRRGALENCALTERFFPGRTCRIHVSGRIPEDVARQLKEAGAEVIVMEQRASYDGLYWRFLPAADRDVDAMVVRDADARLSLREKSAVDQWLESGKALHVMRDHPGHRRLIPAGLWGCRGNAIPDIAALIETFGRESGFESRTGDAEFLARHVYPRFRSDMFVHSAFSYFPGETPHQIPVPRYGNDYLGRPVGRDEVVQKRVRDFDHHKGQGQVLRPFPEGIVL
jgi:hypothetical protein